MQSIIDPDIKPKSPTYDLLCESFEFCKDLFVVVGGGFEPPKASPTDLQSVPFDHSGTPPCRFHTE